MPGDWNTLVNSGAVWLLVAFLISAVAPSTAWAVVAGMGTLIVEVMGYFVSVWLLVGVDIPFGGTLFWLLVAVVAGPIFGIAGHWWRVGNKRQHVLALALMGGVFLAEGSIAMLWGEQYKLTSRRVEISIGLLIPLLLGRSWQTRLAGVGALFVIVPLGLTAYQVINWAIVFFNH